MDLKADYISMNNTINDVCCFTAGFSKFTRVSALLQCLNVTGVRLTVECPDYRPRMRKKSPDR
jgi:hypothetical protein